MPERPDKQLALQKKTTEHKLITNFEAKVHKEKLLGKWIYIRVEKRISFITLVCVTKKEEFKKIAFYIV